MAKTVDDIIKEAKRKAVVERAYLHFYNNTLLANGLITSEQHRQMKVYITTRKPSMER